MIGKQILLVSTLGNVSRKVGRICKLMLGCKVVKVLKETRMTAVFISSVLRIMVILYSDVK